MDGEFPLFLSRKAFVNGTTIAISVDPAHAIDRMIGILER